MKKNLPIILILFLVVVGAFFIFKKHAVAPVEQVPTQSQEIAITTVSVAEQNYSGSYPKITGGGAIAVAARVYVANEIASFKKDADNEVPDIRKEFGSDSPSAQYTIDIQGTYQKGSVYDSIILSEYTFTGGAHGNSVSKVFTASKDGAIVSLKDVISKTQQAAFVSYVKKKLLAYDSEDMQDGQPVVFTDEVEKLTLGSFENWSMDAKNLTIYFDRYAVAPGVVGDIDLQLPRKDVAKFLK